MRDKFVLAPMAQRAKYMFYNRLTLGDQLRPLLNPLGEPFHSRFVW